MRSAVVWHITQRLLVIPKRRFGTTYRSQLQGSRNPKRNSWVSQPSDEYYFRIGTLIQYITFLAVS